MIDLGGVEAEVVTEDADEAVVAAEVDIVVVEEDPEVEAETEGQGQRGQGQDLNIEDAPDLGQGHVPIINLSQDLRNKLPNHEKHLLSNRVKIYNAITWYLVELNFWTFLLKENHNIVV